MRSSEHGNGVGVLNVRTCDTSPGPFPYCLLGALLLVTGCSSIRTEVGGPFQANATPFVEGGTRVESVVRELGPPHAVSALPDGCVFLYEHSVVKEFQFGLSLKFIRLPYFKLIKADSQLSESARLLMFDEKGVLRAEDSETWREKLGGGGALQWITAVHGLTDTVAFREVPTQLTWGRSSLQPPPVTLNLANDLSQGNNGLEQRMAPAYVGQSTLEMARPRPIKAKRSRTRR